MNILKKSISNNFQAKKLTLMLYSILWCMFFSNSVIASIVYSGPISQSGPNFTIDINNDGDIDFATQWTQMIFGSNGSYSSSYDVNLNFNIRFLNTELVGHSGFPGSKAVLEQGVIIGPDVQNTLLWSYNSNDGMLWESLNFYTDPIVYSGSWNNITNGYMGFELLASTEMFYGWLQFNVDSTNNITLVDFAYEDTPNVVIAAGATSVPIPTSIWLFATGLASFITFRRKN